MGATGQDRHGSGGASEGATRSMVYCVVPRDLAPKLHAPLRRHFRDDPSVEVIVERRGGDRRGAEPRRSPQRRPPRVERRAIRNAEGRRVGERRASLVPLERPPLPRRAERHADRLVFVERLEPTTQHLEDLDTARLVTRFQAGDRDAFDTLYLRYFDRVYSYLLVVFRDSHEAEDATQQVFLQVLEALSGYERRTRPFGAWLFTIARNHALGQLKKHGRAEVTDPAEIHRRRERLAAEEPDLGLHALDWISDRELLFFVERLPLPQRQVLLLRYLFDLTHKEVAQMLGRSPDDVRILQHRAQTFLKDRLTAVGRGPKRADRARMRSPTRYSTVLRGRRFSLWG